MDAAVSLLANFPPRLTPRTNQEYDEAARHHEQQVQKLCKTEARLIASQHTRLFQILEPGVHSISYLYVLAVLLGSIGSGEATIDEDHFWLNVVSFLLSFDSRQIRYTGSLWSGLLERVIGGGVLSNEQTVQIATKALLRLDPSGSILTTHHVTLLDFAYKSNQVDHIFLLIDKDVTFYPRLQLKQLATEYICDPAAPACCYVRPELGLTGLLSSSQILQYDFVCGLAQCSGRRWLRAQAAFERVITYPANKDVGASNIMVEAYKKWVLVSLLATGTAPVSPLSSASAHTKRVYESLAKPYVDLASHFDAAEPQQLREIADRHADIWRDDQNTGLLQEVIRAYQAWQIVRLRDVYSNISITSIREQTISAESLQPSTSDEEVGAIVRSILSSGMLRGHLQSEPSESAKPLHLTCLPTQEDCSEAEFGSRVASAAHKLQGLAPVLKFNREQLGASREYLRHTIKEQQREQETASRRNGAVDFSHMVEDEDLLR